MTKTRPKKEKYAYIIQLKTRKCKFLGEEKLKEYTAAEETDTNQI